MVIFISWLDQVEGSAARAADYACRCMPVQGTNASWLVQTIDTLELDSLVQGLAMLVVLGERKDGSARVAGCKLDPSTVETKTSASSNEQSSCYYTLSTNMHVDSPCLEVSTICKFMMLGKSDMIETGC